MSLRRKLLVEDHLRDPRTVTNIEEDQIAVIPPAIHQPIITAVLPVSPARRSPHISVRCRLPKKSSVTMALLYEVRTVQSS